MPPTGGLGCNPGMCSYWESNLPPFGWQAGTQPTEPHQPERQVLFFKWVDLGVAWGLSTATGPDDHQKPAYAESLCGQQAYFMLQ